MTESEPGPAITSTTPAHEVSLPAPASTAPQATPAALRIQTAPPTPPPPVSSAPPVIDQYYSLPLWIIYLIGALVLAVILALIVVLTMVQKIRR